MRIAIVALVFITSFYFRWIPPPFCEDLIVGDDDSLAMCARMKADSEFDSGRFAIYSGNFKGNGYYAEEVLESWYGIKTEIEKQYWICGTGRGTQDFIDEIYYSTIDSLMLEKYGEDIFQRVDRAADSLEKLYPDRYPDKGQPIIDCWYSPTYIPNNDSMYADLRKTLHYPPAARRDDISGTVYVKLILDPTGAGINAFVVKGVRRDLDSAAIDAVDQLGKFQTEIIDGAQQPGEVVIPVRFVLE